MAIINKDTSIETWRLAFNGLDSDFRSGKTVRTLISSFDAGGLGSLSYNQINGVITYTGPSNSDIRSLFSTGAGIIQYDSATGQFTSTAFGTASYDSEGIAKFDSSGFTITNGSVSIKAGSISSTKLTSAVSLVIYNSAGAAVKTLYGAGS
jgi:hypothetical protein